MSSVYSHRQVLGLQTLTPCSDYFNGGCWQPKLRSPCLHHRHFTNWAIPTAPKKYVDSSLLWCNFSHSSSCALTLFHKRQSDVKKHWKSWLGLASPAVLWHWRYRCWCCPSLVTRHLTLINCGMTRNMAGKLNRNQLLKDAKAGGPWV